MIILFWGGAQQPALTGTVQLSFTTAGTATLFGELATNSTVTFTPAGTLTGDAPLLSTTIPITLTPVGALTGDGALISTIPMLFSSSGVFDGAEDDDGLQIGDSLAVGARLAAGARLSIWAGMNSSRTVN